MMNRAQRRADMPYLINLTVCFFVAWRSWSRVSAPRVALASADHSIQSRSDRTKDVHGRTRLSTSMGSDQAFHGPLA